MYPKEWLFTTNPGLFGLYPGIANITGWLLCLVLAIMGVCSLPSVRKGGYFEVNLTLTYRLFAPETDWLI